jgi:hypothetical protein
MPARSEEQGSHRWDAKTSALEIPRIDGESTAQFIDGNNNTHAQTIKFAITQPRVIRRRRRQLLHHRSQAAGLSTRRRAMASSTATLQAGRSHKERRRSRNLKGSDPFLDLSDDDVKHAAQASPIRASSQSRNTTSTGNDEHAESLLSDVNPGYLINSSTRC